MTHCISTSYRDDNGNFCVIPHAEPWHHMFGFFKDKKRLWGHPVMKRLGVQHLTLLSVTDPIYFRTPDELDNAYEDMIIITSNLHIIHEETGVDEQRILRYMNNLELAIMQAREVNGVISIG